MCNGKIDSENNSETVIQIKKQIFNNELQLDYKFYKLHSQAIYKSGF